MYSVLSLFEGYKTYYINYYLNFLKNSSLNFMKTLQRYNFFLINFFPTLGHYKKV